jgi:hypothetical protein
LKKPRITIRAQVSHNEAMPTVEAWLRRELRASALELRKLAYTLPNGVGEYNLLQLSDRMSAAAEEVVHDRRPQQAADESRLNSHR